MIYATYLATNPAHAMLLTLEPFEEDVVKAVSNMREIEEAEARRRVTLRLQTGPDEWHLLWLTAIEDFDDIKIDQVSPERGDWPPKDHEMLIERSALGLLKADIGDTVTVKTPDGKLRDMRISGLDHDLNAQMYVFDGMAIGYTTANTLEWLRCSPRGRSRGRQASSSPLGAQLRDLLDRVRLQFLCVSVAAHSTSHKP